MSVRLSWTLLVCSECGEMDEDEAVCGFCESLEGVTVVEVAPVDLLREVAVSGVESDYMGVGYVTVQIDRATWDALAPYRTGVKS